MLTMLDATLLTIRSRSGVGGRPPTFAGRKIVAERASRNAHRTASFRQTKR